MNLKEWRGFKGKTPCLPPLSTGKQGRGCPGRRRPWAGGPGARRRPQEGGKGAGRHWGTIPLPNFRGGGSQWRRHGSQRRSAAGVRGGGAAGIQWRPGLGENGEESSMNPIPTLVRAGAQRGEELRGGRLRVQGGYGGRWR